MIYSEQKKDQCIVRSYVKGYTNLIYHTYYAQKPVNMLIKLCMSYMYTSSIYSLGIYSTLNEYAV